MWQSVDLRTAAAGFAFCYQIERLPLLRGLRNAGRNHLMRRESKVGSCRAITLPQVAAAAGWLNGVGDLQPELWWQSDYKLYAIPLCSSWALNTWKTRQNKDEKSRKLNVGTHMHIIKCFPSVCIFLVHYSKVFFKSLYDQWWHITNIVGLIALHAAYSVVNGDGTDWVVIPRLVASSACWVTQE